MQQLLGVTDYDLTVRSVNDKSMQRINTRYRGRREPTDVLAFPPIEVCVTGMCVCVCFFFFFFFFFVPFCLVSSLFGWLANKLVPNFQPPFPNQTQPTLFFFVVELGARD
jgi:hypothetical protein